MSIFVVARLWQEAVDPCRRAEVASGSCPFIGWLQSCGKILLMFLVVAMLRAVIVCSGEQTARLSVWKMTSDQRSTSLKTYNATTYSVTPSKHRSGLAANRSDKQSSENAEIAISNKIL